jgi:hypothetical protein
VKQAKEWIDLHLAHLDYNSDLTAEQQSSSERLRRTATYILQVRRGVHVCRVHVE